MSNCVLNLLMTSESVDTLLSVIVLIP